jgi:CMP-N-acetylneuraminic acid synthetase
MSKVLAIIPARGGSKRVPGKNILDFCGKPMIAWSIEAAQKSKLFDAIVVSTDNEEIAKVAIKYGALVPSLRKIAADDLSPVSEATIHTIEQLESQGLYFDVVVQLFAVCPLRNAEDIKKAYSFFVNQKTSFLISCFKYVWMNPWWAVKLDEHHKPQRIFEDTLIRSQDLPELFCPTGAVWIANITSLKRSNTFYGQDHIFWEMDWERALDIDSYEDIELGKKLFKK